MKGGTMKKILNNVCHNQVVLYALSILALFNLIGYLIRNNLAAICAFLLIGFGTTQLTKNMIFILSTAIVGTELFVIFGLFKPCSVQEGLDNKLTTTKDTTKDTDTDEDEDTVQDIDNECSDGMTWNKKLEKCVAKHSKLNKNNTAIEFDETSVNIEAKPSTNAKDPLTTKKGGKAMGFSNFDDVSVGDNLSGGTKVNYAKTVEDAFDKLEKILGSDGMRKMTDDTSKLADKQANLISAMKNMEPLMKTAESMLGKLEGSSFMNILQSNPTQEQPAGRNIDED